MENVRTIMKRRDNLTDAEVDDLFEEFASLLEDNLNPEDAIAEVFGLEPDYVTDDEVRAAIWT